MGGNLVRILGSGLGGSPFVTLGHLPVSSVLPVSDQEVDVIAPANPAGLANLTVVDAGGESATALGAYVFLPAPPIPRAARWYVDGGDASHATPILVTGSGALSGLDIAPPLLLTGSISGSLDQLGAAGGPAPLPGEPILAVRRDGSQGAVTTLAGPDGEWQLTGLAPGAWLLTTGESGRSDLYDQAWPGVTDLRSAVPVEVAAGADLPGHSLVLSRGGGIQGRITGNGNGIGGVAVTAVPVSGSTLQARSALTATDGSFALTGLAPGLYLESAQTSGSGRVSEYWPGVYSASLAQSLSIAAGGIVDGSLDLDPAGSICGRLIETPDGQGLPGIPVVAHDLSRGTDAETASGADGSYDLSGLPAGSYRVGVPEMGLYYLAVSSTSSATPIVIAGGQTNSGVNFVGRLGNATCGTGTIAVTGHALAPDRSPLFRALVSVASTTGGQAASTESGLDGGWAVCLSSGSYSGQVSAPSSSYLTGSFSVTLSGSNEVVLRSGATLTGFILDPATNAAIPGVPVRLVGTNGSGTVQASGPDGHFRLDHDAGGGIAPGSWFLSADPSEIIDSP